MQDYQYKVDYQIIPNTDRILDSTSLNLKAAPKDPYLFSMAFRADFKK